MSAGGNGNGGWVGDGQGGPRVSFAPATAPRPAGERNATPSVDNVPLRYVRAGSSGTKRHARDRPRTPHPAAVDVAVRTLNAMSHVPAVLSIAGSDSGGGAGIQADLKAFARCGVHGMTAITALTAQNTTGVSAIQTVPPEFIIEQVRQVATDIGVDAVKIGMLGTAETVVAVDSALDLLDPSTPIVIDPVMVAESGAMLLDDGARAALAELLIPRATVITPEPPRGQRARRRPTPSDAEALARRLHRLGPRAVVVTGGHRDEVTDVFYDGDHARDAERPAPSRRRRPRLGLHALERAGRPPRPRRRPARAPHVTLVTSRQKPYATAFASSARAPARSTCSASGTAPESARRRRVGLQRLWHNRRR